MKEVQQEYVVCPDQMELLGPKAKLEIGAQWDHKVLRVHLAMQDDQAHQAFRVSEDLKDEQALQENQETLAREEYKELMGNLENQDHKDYKDCQDP